MKMRIAIAKAQLLHPILGATVLSQERLFHTELVVFECIVLALCVEPVCDILMSPGCTSTLCKPKCMRTGVFHTPLLATPYKYTLASI